MKKLTFITAIALSALMAVSCGQKKTAEAEAEAAVEKSQAEIQAEEVIKVHLDSLASELNKVNPIGIIGSVKDGSIVLSDKEKQVKPDYLVSATIANDLQTLSQKYRAIAILCVDNEIAKLYDMPTSDYQTALAKLYADVNDPALKAFSEGLELKESINNFYDESKANGRENLFWESVTTALIEQMYIACQNTDKFIVAFDDETTTTFTWYVVLLTLAVDDLAQINPEYASLNEALAPLTKIDAISVDMFKKQLEEVKAELETSHANLLK
ncbi:MAG: hypothetical protein MJY42_01520 [Bacteroidales bacterium]|nr:hypothetical protein [Bacteroidales bacterium]